MTLLLACAPAPAPRDGSSTAPGSAASAPLAPLPAGGDLRAAILVGYDPPGREVGAEAGVRALADALQDAGEFPSPFLLLGEEARPAKLRDLLHELTGRGRPGPEDQLLVYVHAHGTWVASGSSAAPALSLAGELVLVDELLAWVDATPAGRKALVLDACYPRRPAAALHRSSSTLLLASQAEDGPAWAEPGRGGRYTGCLADALSDPGIGSLLAGHAQAAVCLGAFPERQTPRAWSGTRPTDLWTRLGDRPAGSWAVHPDGRVTPAEGPSPVTVLASGEHRRPPAEAPPLVLATAGSGLDALAGVHPQSLVAFLWRGQEALLVQSVEGPRLQVRRDDDTFVDHSDVLTGVRGDARGSRARLLDLDGAGRPEACFLGEGLWCVSDRGPRRVLREARPVAVPMQGDLDGDGDLDLIVEEDDGTRPWWWEAGAYRRGDPLPARDLVAVDLLRVDGHPGADLITSSTLRGTELWSWRRGAWRRFLGAEMGLPTGQTNAVVSTARGDGRWELRVPAMRAATSIGWGFPQALLQFGPAVPGPDERLDVPLLGLLVGDLDLDGADDLVHLHRRAGGIEAPDHQVFLQRAAGWAPLPVPGLDVGRDSQQALLHDLDGDGDLDLLALAGGFAPGPLLRWLRNDTGGRGAVLQLAGAPALGAEVRLKGARTWLRRVEDAAARVWIGLGHDAPPARVEVDWPDGERTTVDPVAWTQDGRAWRGVVRRASVATPDLLVGGWRIDLSASPEGRVRPAAALDGASGVSWLVQLPDGDLLAGARVGGGLEARWVGQGGVATRRGQRLDGCDWPTVTSAGVLLGCGGHRGGSYVEEVAVLPVAGGPLRVPPIAAEVRGLPRGWASWRGRFWVASGATHLTAWAPDLARRASGDLPAPPGSRTRERLHAGADGTLLVLDTWAGRVERWRDESGPPELLPVGDVTGQPAWSEAAGWAIPTTTGLALVGGPADGLLHLPGPVSSVTTWDGAAAAVVHAPDPELYVVDLGTRSTRMTVPLPSARLGPVGVLPPASAAGR